jgi:hypothetical protein
MMVARLKGNQLVFWTLLANAFYWLAGAITPNPYVSSAASLALLLSSAWMFLRYAPHAFDVVVNRRRDTGEGGENSHISLYGATLIAGGSCFIGMFGFLWVLAGQPENWLGTSISGYGRAVCSVGFAMMALSPDRTPSGVRMPNLIMIVLLIIAVAVGSFFAGRKTVPQEQAVYWRSIRGALADKPVCSPDRQIWGSENRKYHVADSQYRAMMSPEWCFRTVSEAEKKGFKPAK